jgi:outer membrane lipoprotein-sorting protein
MNNRARIAAFIVAAHCVAFIGAGSASAKGLTAEEVIAQMIQRDPLGYGGAEADVMMILINKRGQKQSRQMVTMSRNDDGKRRMFVRFGSPADIAGTAFLGINEKGERIQHLYLPALAKVRRISGSNRNGRFVGSDYSYADMDYTDWEKSTKKLLPEEKVSGQDAYVVELRPTDEDSEYARVMLWIGKKTLLPLRIRYFDTKGAEIKRMTVQEVKQEAKKWLITESKMVDLSKEHTTVLKVSSVKLRDDIPLEQFTVRALDRE